MAGAATEEAMILEVTGVDTEEMTGVEGVEMTLDTIDDRDAILAMNSSSGSRLQVCWQLINI